MQPDGNFNLRLIDTEIVVISSLPLPPVPLPPPSVPPLSQDEARQALMRKMDKQWFVSKAPAINFTFVRITPSSCYRVSAERLAYLLD